MHDDLVQRQFSAQAPNQVWLADITEHRTDEGKLYLCAINDVYSNRIVGYSIDLNEVLARGGRPRPRSGPALDSRDNRPLRQG